MFCLFCCFTTFILNKVYQSRLCENRQPLHPSALFMHLRLCAYYRPRRVNSVHDIWPPPFDRGPFDRQRFDNLYLPRNLWPPVVWMTHPFHSMSILSTKYQNSIIIRTRIMQQECFSLTVRQLIFNKIGRNNQIPLEVPILLTVVASVQFFSRNSI